MGEQAFPQIGPERARAARGVEVEAERLFPSHTAPDRSGGLAVGEPCDVLHDADEGQAPGGPCHRAPLRRIESGDELIVIQRAERRMQGHREMACGNCSAYCGYSRFRHWGKWVRTQSQGSPFDSSTTLLLPTRETLASESTARPGAADLTNRVNDACTHGLLSCVRLPHAW